MSIKEMIVKEQKDYNEKRRRSLEMVEGFFHILDERERYRLIENMPFTRYKDVAPFYLTAYENQKIKVPRYVAEEIEAIYSWVPVEDEAVQKSCKLWKGSQTDVKARPYMKQYRFAFDYV